MGKIALNKEGAEALRDFANKMEKALSEIDGVSTAFKGMVVSNADEIGVHGVQFVDLAEEAVKVAKKVQEAGEPLPKKMKKKADDIDAYVAAHISKN